MVTVIARYVVRDSHVSTVTQLLAKNAAATRAEPACLEFSVYQQLDDPQALLLYERYTNEEAFQEHRLTPHFLDIIERQVASLLDERVWSRMDPHLE